MQELTAYEKEVAEAVFHLIDSEQRQIITTAIYRSSMNKLRNTSGLSLDRFDEIWEYVESADGFRSMFIRVSALRSVEKNYEALKRLED